MLTESERLFEDFCTLHGIMFQPIKTASHPTADYRIWSSNIEIVCEVKQIEPSPEEIIARQALERGEHVVTGGTPGARVRSKIKDALPQLRNLAKGKYPALLVLTDVSFYPGHLGPYEIRVAMYGLDTIVLGVPRNPMAAAYVRDRKSGPKRKMTHAHNTTISALAELRKNRNGCIACDIYHNRFATHPLARKAIAFKDVHHFRLQESQPGRLDDWEEF